MNRFCDFELCDSHPLAPQFPLVRHPFSVTSPVAFGLPKILSLLASFHRFAVVRRIRIIDANDHPC